MKQLSKYINEQFIVEHYVTLIEKTDIQQYAHEILEILFQTYSHIGGCGIDTPDQLVTEADLIKIIRRNGHISAVNVYTTKRGGRKAIAGGCDGTEQGKRDFMKIFYEDFDRKEREMFIEVSGKALGSILKLPNITILPAFVAQQVMSDKDVVPCPDGYFYTRTVHGVKKAKLMCGEVKGYASYTPTDEIKQELKRLSMQYENK